MIPSAKAYMSQDPRASSDADSTTTEGSVEALATVYKVKMDFLPRLAAFRNDATFKLSEEFYNIDQYKRYGEILTSSTGEVESRVERFIFSTDYTAGRDLEYLREQLDEIIRNLGTMRKVCGLNTEVRRLEREVEAKRRDSGNLEEEFRLSGLLAEKRAESRMLEAMIVDVDF